MEITEQIKFDIFTHINESLGTFENQYKIAENLSKNIYEMIFNNEKQKTFKVESEMIDFVDVIIEKNILKTNAKIYGLNDETKTIKLVINLNKNDLKDKNYFIGLLKNILTHELMHGIFF